MLKIDFEILLGKPVRVVRTSEALLDILENFTSMGKALDCCLTIAEAALWFSDNVFKKERRARKDCTTLDEIHVTVSRDWFPSMNNSRWTLTTSIGYNGKEVVRIQENGETGFVTLKNMEWLELFMEHSRSAVGKMAERNKENAKTLKIVCEQYRKKEGKTK